MVVSADLILRIEQEVLFIVFGASVIHLLFRGILKLYSHLSITRP